MVIKNNYQAYFFNNQYNDGLINDAISRFKRQLYTKALKSEETGQCIERKYFSGSDLLCNATYNWKHGYAVGTYILNINEDVVSHINPDRFLRKYNYGQKISMATFLGDTKTFQNFIFLTIDKYAIFEFSLIFNRNGFQIILEPTSISVNDINLFKSLVSLDSPITITTVRKMNSASAYNSRSDLFQTYGIAYDKFSATSSVGKDITGTWSLYMNLDESHPFMMIQTMAILYKAADGKYYFSVPDAFKSYIYANHTTTIKCYAFQEYNYSGNTSFVFSGSNVPIYQIPINTNPIPPTNFMVWTYDSVNKVKGRLLENNISVKYPNIYDFRNMWDGSSSLFIEWYNTGGFSNILFDNNFEDYMAAHSDYMSSIINTTAPSSILSYTPLSDFALNVADYKASTYYGDIRAYILSKLVTLVSDNPERYQDFIKKCNQNIKYNIHHSFNTPFTGIPKTYISETKTYVDQMCYIKVDNSLNVNRPTILYIDGKCTPITEQTTVNGTSKIYFKASLLSGANVVEIDIFNCPFNPVFESDDFNFENDEYRFYPKNVLYDKISPRDIMLVYNDTDKIITNQYLLAYRLKTRNVILQSLSDPDVQIEYLVDDDSAIVKPLEADYIALSTMDSNVDYSELSYKYFDPSHLMIKPDNELLYQSLKLVNTNFFLEKSFVNVGADNTTLTIPNFKGKRDVNRFRVFIDGVLLQKSQYSVFYLGEYNSDIEIRITSIISTATHDAVVQYLPFDESYVIDDIPSNDIYINGILYLDTLLSNPLDINLCRFYIDGKRIPNSKVHQLSINDAIYIEGYSNTSRLTITIQNVDTDCYEYTDIKNTSCFLTDIAKHDTVFSSYLKSHI